MEDELVREVRSRFGASADAVTDLLAEYGSDRSHREPDRVRRAILTLSGSDEDRLLHYVEVALMDYRDVLWWAEHPKPPDEPMGHDRGEAHCRPAAPESPGER